MSDTNISNKGVQKATGKKLEQWFASLYQKDPSSEQQPGQKNTSY